MRCMDGERAVGAGVPDHFHLSNHHRHYRINVVWSFSRPLPPGSSYNLSPHLTITVPSIHTHNLYDPTHHTTYASLTWQIWHTEASPRAGRQKFLQSTSLFTLTNLLPKPTRDILDLPEPN